LWLKNYQSIIKSKNYQFSLTEVTKIGYIGTPHYNKLSVKLLRLSETNPKSGHPTSPETWGVQEIVQSDNLIKTFFEEKLTGVISNIKEK